MNPKYDIYEQIDLYLSNQLNGEELAQFNEKLATDVELQETLEAQKIANQLIVDQEMIKLKERMQRDMSPTPPSAPGSKLPYRIIKVAAISAIVASGAYFTYNQNTSETPTAAKSNTNKSTLVVANTEQDASNTEKTSATVAEAKSAPVKPIIEETAKANTQENTQLTEAIPKAVAIEKVNNAAAQAVANHQTVTYTQQETASAAASPVIDCHTLKLETSVHVEYINEEANIVISKKVRGGTAPYTFALDQGEFTADHRFQNVKEGTYLVSVKDANHCVSALSKPVVVAHPVKEIDDVFNPSNGEKWTFPGVSNADASITIVNKTGLTVFALKISNGYPSEWDGKDENGAGLNAGDYFFIVSFTNNKMIKGHISIVK